jgi:DNA-binding CsgD family transcriptional regulator/PAS domain-containing protein
LQEATFISTLGMIHDAAFRPAAWAGVLQRLASLTGAIAGGLTQEDPNTGRGTPITYFGFDPAHVARTFDYFLPLNPLFGIADRMQPGFIVTNGDVVPTDVFRRSAFYDGWARPQGLCSPITLVTHRSSGRYLPLTLVRPDGAGEASREERAVLARFAPHLMHAVKVGLHVQTAEARERQLLAALAGLPQAAMLVDADRRVTFVNEAAEAFLSRATTRPLDVINGELVASDPKSDGRLQAALSVGLREDGLATGIEIEINGPVLGEKFMLTLSPLPLDDFWAATAGLGPARRSCMVLIEDWGISTLAARHALTPSETRLVQAIIVGKGLAWAARELGISRSTAQSHLDKVFQKTNTNRQAELVAFVIGRKSQ